MKKVLRSLASTLVLVSLAEAAQAQANLVHGIVAGISLIGNASTAGSSDKSYSDKTVANVTYENRAYPMKRTPADKLTGKAADQIALLESQLQKCRMRMITSRNWLFIWLRMSGGSGPPTSPLQFRRKLSTSCLLAAPPKGKTLEAY